MKFTKPATSVIDQLALLRRRGMVIDDEPAARHYLQHISYYRLRAYWLTYETSAAAVTMLFDPARGLRMCSPYTSSTGSCACW